MEVENEMRDKRDFIPDSIVKEVLPGMMMAFTDLKVNDKLVFEHNITNLPFKLEATSLRIAYGNWYRCKLALEILQDDCFKECNNPHADVMIEYFFGMTLGNTVTKYEDMFDQQLISNGEVNCDNPNKRKWVAKKSVSAFNGEMCKELAYCTADFSFTIEKITIEKDK